MSTDALLFMLISESVIACVTIYFFVKILRSKQQFNKQISVSEEKEEIK